MVVTLGQQYNVGEKTTTYINSLYLVVPLAAIDFATDTTVQNQKTSKLVQYCVFGTLSYSFLIYCRALHLSLARCPPFGIQKSNLDNLGSLMQDVSLDVTSWEEEENSIKTKWKFRCVLGLPWKPTLAAAGVSNCLLRENC